MALFTDGPSSTIEDLTNQDSGLLDVCRVEQINATTKLMLAHDEIAMDLQSLCAGQRSVHAHLHEQWRLTVRHIAVTPPLTLWQTFRTLSLVYRDAYFNQLNDRYQAKWKQFDKLSEDAYQRFRETGAGLVLDPLPRPASPLLSATPATESGGTFYFSVSLLNATCEESASSTPCSLTVPAGNAVNIALVSPPSNATGWNVYVGTTPTGLYLQNNSGLTAGMDWIFYPSTLAVSGGMPGAGQTPNYIRALPRLNQRG